MYICSTGKVEHLFWWFHFRWTHCWSCSVSKVQKSTSSCRMLPVRCLLRGDQSRNPGISLRCYMDMMYVFIYIYIHNTCRYICVYTYYTYMYVRICLKMQLPLVHLWYPCLRAILGMQLMPQYPSHQKKHDISWHIAISISSINKYRDDVIINLRTLISHIPLMSFLKTPNNSPQRNGSIDIPLTAALLPWAAAWQL